MRDAIGVNGSISNLENANIVHYDSSSSASGSEDGEMDDLATFMASLEQLGIQGGSASRLNRRSSSSNRKKHHDTKSQKMKSLKSFVTRSRRSMVIVGSGEKRNNAKSNRKLRGYALARFR